MNEHSVTIQLNQNRGTNTVLAKLKYAAAGSKSILYFANITYIYSYSAV